MSIDKILGQKIAAPSQYDKSILVREERQTNRTALGICNENIPFAGFDIWNCYEISALTDNGLPVTAIAKIVYPASSKYIVESKSLKLYLNSFNMTKMGPSRPEVITRVKNFIREDLYQLLECSIGIEFFPSYDSYFEDRIYIPPFEHIPYSPGFPGSRKWFCLDLDCNTVFTDYKENPNLLKFSSFNNEVVECCDAVFSTLLRSNCKITHQQDVGNVFIYYRGPHYIDRTSLLQYIVSFRNENHFHEECTEAIFKRIWDFAKPNELMVFCPYVRRGGISIAPIRASHSFLIPDKLKFYFEPYIKSVRE